MPFTFSHASAVLPLKNIKRSWFSLTGLFFGSIVPDFEYFFKLKIEDKISETAVGFFLFNFPLAVILSFLFHETARNFLIKNLPSPLDKNYSYWLRFDFLSYLRKNWPVFIISCVIGIASHLLLDFFFENEKIFSELNIYYLENFGIKFNILIERIFSAAAFIPLIIFVLRYKKKDDEYVSESIKEKIKFWGEVLGLALALLSIRIFFENEKPDIPYFIVASIGSGIAGFLIICGIKKFNT